MYLYTIRITVLMARITITLNNSIHIFVKSDIRNEWRVLKTKFVCRLNSVIDACQKFSKSSLGPLESFSVMDIGVTVWILYMNVSFFYILLLFLLQFGKMYSEWSLQVLRYIIVIKTRIVKKISHWL